MMLSFLKITYTNIGTIYKLTNLERMGTNKEPTIHVKALVN